VRAGRVLGRIEPQLWQLLCGLFEVVPPQLTAVFDYAELEHLLCGIQEVSSTPPLRELIPVEKMCTNTYRGT
jgi:HECT-domain (ubiquitin-transferase)